MKILLTDLDDTLLDWTKSFDTFIRENYSYNGVFLTENPQRLWEVLNVSKDEVIDIMLSHTKIERFGQLNYYKDASILNLHNDKFDKIIAITSCGNHSDIIKKRNANVYSLFPVIDDIIYLDFLQQKEAMLQSLITEYPDAEFYMIDDNIIDVRSALNLGINACAYRTAFHDPVGLPVVDSLSEFFEKIVK